MTQTHQVERRGKHVRCRKGDQRQGTEHLGDPHGAWSLDSEEKPHVAAVGGIQGKRQLSILLYQVVRSGDIAYSY